VIEHTVEIDGSAAEVWAALVDFGSYPMWNPYVLAVVGDTAVGGVPAVTIAQDNWPEPITVRPIIVRLDPPRVLHWHGEIGEPGIFDTDHSFELEAVSASRVRFVQREEFRGSHASRIDDEAKAFTRRAFQAMNDALAARVEALQRPR
jgi:hypothetical protein